ncbi:hypothetical protein NA56DRAFT_665442 [Hyaloscypha hepaticicola]|uniref:Uncharacterized protein n=1 Tax=Hyaloscypha hepaticicola TaxID=2082293 RepID=A0A2J6PHZ2_9HELO|nr:hypothetical protein NA56DRAFT_665442 [Hyaloscypha hepaticicola]
MLSLTAIPTAILALDQARANLARGAEVTKSVATVVTIMLQEAYNVDESTSQFTGYVASIINICQNTNPGAACPFDPTPPFDGVTVTQGAQGQLMTYSESDLSISESCFFTATTATQANCTNYSSLGNQTGGGGAESYTATNSTYTRSFTKGLWQSDWDLYTWGAPPFVPVTVTAGADKARVVPPTGTDKNAGIAFGTATPTTTKGSGSDKLRLLDSIVLRGALMIIWGVAFVIL